MPSNSSAITGDNCRVIYRNSRYSGIMVTENRNHRDLYMDGDILQSSMLFADPNGLYLEYSQAMMCALLFQSVPKRVLLVGLGGGSLVKFLLEHCPQAGIDVAEINPEVIRVAREYFLVPDSGRLRIIHAAGEAVVAEQLAAGESYDLIFLDAFDDDGPARALLEEDFLRNCRSLLAKNGVFAMNLWNRPVDNFPAIFAYLNSLFGKWTHKLLLDNYHSNAIVFGFNEPLRVKNLMGLKPEAKDLSRRTGINFMRWLRQIHWQNMGPSVVQKFSMK